MPESPAEATSDYDSIDFFTDQSLVPDPYPYFDHLRAQCPVLKTDNYGVYAVTGYDEASVVYKDADLFSSCIAVGGPSRRCRSPLRVPTSPGRSRPTVTSS